MDVCTQPMTSFGVMTLKKSPLRSHTGSSTPGVRICTVLDANHEWARTLVIPVVRIAPTLVAIAGAGRGVGAGRAATRTGAGVGGAGVVTVTVACERTGRSSDRATINDTAETTATPAKIAVIAFEPSHPKTSPQDPRTIPDVPMARQANAGFGFPWAFCIRAGRTEEVRSRSDHDCCCCAQARALCGLGDAGGLTVPRPGPIVRFLRFASGARPRGNVVRLTVKGKGRRPDRFPFRPRCSRCDPRPFTHVRTPGARSGTRRGSCGGMGGGASGHRAEVIVRGALQRAAQHVELGLADTARRAAAPR